MSEILDFRNKKIAILGLSTEGKDSAKFFASIGAKVYCCDRKNKQELGDSYQELEKLGVKFRLGKDYLSDLNQYDLLIRTPGMALFLPEFIKKNKKAPISSQTKIFFDFCPCRIIGVTGTKGKGTVSSLISKMLENQGKKVYLGGNIGNPLLSRLQKINKDDFVVMELSSFQLEDLSKSPFISVVLRINQDHLANYDPNSSNFHKSVKEYIEAKKSLVRYQTKNDCAVFNLDDPISHSFAKETSAQKFYFSQHNKHATAYIENKNVWLYWQGKKRLICSLNKIKLRGVHNLENIAAATIAATVAGVALKNIRKTAISFQPLEHRLELVKEVNGVTFYNDSFSTTPETTIAAINSFNQPIILIAGGTDKGSNFSRLAKEIILSKVKTIILIGVMGSKIKDEIITALKKLNIKPNFSFIEGCKNMNEIVQTAKKHAKPGDIVLLSPACASFDMFRNYKDRGEQYKFFVKNAQEIPQ